MHRKVFIHIGFGKTGSSALQIWLNDNTKIIQEKGVYYPVFSHEKLSAYEITCGNGVFVLESLRNNEFQKFFNKLSKECSNDILFSSEMFQEMTDDEIEELIAIVQSFSFKVEIVAYVRDIYDMAYSSYQQLVKRHSLSDSFSEYCKKQKNMQQFSTLRKIESHFNTIHLLHYNSCLKEGIEKQFCKAVNIEPKSIPSMSKKQVNRSLTAFETDLVRSLNRVFMDNFNVVDFSFSTAVSDSLIYSNPEAKPEILYDEESHKYLELTMRDKVNAVNKKYFQNNNVLVFIKKNEKRKIITKNLEITPEFLVTISAIFDYFKKQLKEVDSNIHIVEEHPPKDIIEYLARAAIELEEKQLDKSLEIMKIAESLRPEGTIIKRMIDNYSSKLNKKENSGTERII